MIPIPDHADRAVARLPARHVEDARMVATVRALVAPLQEVEAALFALLTIAAIDSSSGVQLDLLGRVVGQERGSLDDASYRVWLKARQRVNRSSGTIPELLAIVRAVAPAVTRVEAIEGYPAGLTVRAFGAPLPLGEEVGALVRSAKVAGVRVVFEFSPAPPAETFRLDVGPGLDVGKLAGATD